MIDNDERWILPATDPIGRHGWYKAQPRERQIEIGMWRQANVAKVGLHFENIMIRGMMEYAFSIPNGSPEDRYCLHEAVEECDRTMMFQEMVNRIGTDIPGMSRPLRWVQPAIPLAGNPLPMVIFFGVLAGEETIDHIQKSVLREDNGMHPIMERVMAIHVAEEARHISFAHEYLRQRVPTMRPGAVPASLAMPLIMRMLCEAIVVPPSAFWKEFDIPRGCARRCLAQAGIAAVPARQLRRRADAGPRERPDEPRRQAGVAELKIDGGLALSQRAAAPAPDSVASGPMPHVVTQSCCSDASCVYACPVNCIHPSPDEPGFLTAEMLYIDPAACVDCGASCQRLPGRRDRPRRPARALATGVPRDQRGVLPGPSGRRKWSRPRWRRSSGPPRRIRATAGR